MDRDWDILVASSDLEMRRSIVAILARLGADAICASTVDQCREVLAKGRVGLVFCDRQFPDGSYKDVIGLAAPGPGEKARIVLTTYFIDPGEYHEARRSGVFEVIASPCHSTAVEWMVILAKRDDRKHREQTLAFQPTNIPSFRRSPAVAGRI
ncbi:MAG: hypothetical protein WA175_07185 [Candidatus Acidiferrales bacterium]